VSRERWLRLNRRKKPIPLSSQLWTTKYAPVNTKEICGNKSNVEKLVQWLQDWCVSRIDGS
jgi:replication factor C subunit 1